VMIGVGALLLLNNLGYLNLSWQVFVSLWPVLLIAIGLDIIIGRHSAWSTFIGILLGIALVASVAWLMLSMPMIERMNNYETYNQSLNNAKSAEIDFSDVVGNMQISSGAEAGNLLDARIRHFSDENTGMDEYIVQDGRGHYQIRSEGYYLYPASGINAATPDWDARLTSSIPLDLDSRLVMGNMGLNLSELKIDQLHAETVMGRVVVDLPRSGFKQGSVNMVMGQVLITVPRGANVKILTNTVIVPVTYPEGFARDGKTVYSLTTDNSQPMLIDVSNVMGVVTVQYR
ncbi:MAG: DUF5668 domain-containing protein, partial [Anaerolineae bacterium]|nr:DUF5668 domain-containing protein [Anaerolineae bacterium]